MPECWIHSLGFGYHAQIVVHFQIQPEILSLQENHFSVLMFERWGGKERKSAYHPRRDLHASQLRIELVPFHRPDSPHVLQNLSLDVNLQLLDPRVENVRPDPEDEQSGTSAQNPVSGSGRRSDSQVLIVGRGVSVAVAGVNHSKGQWPGHIISMNGFLSGFAAKG